MYLSGRPLHAVTTNLAAMIAEEFEGELPLSFAGGADCFNVADLLGAGMRTVTVCSDLLKSGGYLRMLQYPENVDAAFDAVGALDTADFIRRTARAGGFEGDGRRSRRRAPPSPTARGSTCASYAEEVRHDWRYQKYVVPDGPVQDAPPAERLRLHRGALPRRVPGRPAGAPLHGRRSLRGLSGGRPHHPPGQPAAGDPRPGLRPPLREHLHPHPPRPAAGDPADQAVHHGAGAAVDDARAPDSPVAPGSAPPRRSRTRPGGDHRGRAGRPGGRGVARLRRPPCHGLRGAARTPAAWSAGRSRPTACRRRRSTRTSAILERLGVEIRYGQQAGVDFTLDDLRARRVRGDLHRRGRPAGEDGWACRARTPGA